MKKKQTLKSKDGDIVDLILKDHVTLKKLIKTLKDPDADWQERVEVFKEFAPLLVAHAKPEEQVLYVYMKDDDELREEGFEGEVEHQLADQMLEEAKRTEDSDLWSARVKVLAELVEHHIKEEEKELLPDFKKHSSKEERLEMGEKFLKRKSKLAERGYEDAPSEREIGEARH